MGSNLGDSKAIPSILGDSCHCLISGWNLRVHSNLGDTVFTVAKWLAFNIGRQLYSYLRFEWRTQNWGKSKHRRLSPKHSRHKTSIWCLQVMFTKCSIRCTKNSSVLLLDDTCVVAVMHFSTTSPDFKMSCIMYMSYYRFLINFRLSPSFRGLSNT